MLDLGGFLGESHGKEKRKRGEKKGKEGRRKRKMGGAWKGKAGKGRVERKRRNKE